MVYGGNIAPKTIQKVQNIADNPRKLTMIITDHIQVPETIARTIACETFDTNAMR